MIKALTSNIVFKEIDSNPNFDKAIGINFIGLYDYSNQSVIMEVVAMPKEHLLRRCTTYGREIYSDIEIQVGDKVIIDIYGVNNSISEGRSLELDGVKYHSFTYDFIYAKINEDSSLKMLNGYILVKRYARKLFETKLDSDIRFFKVIQVSKPIRYHYFLRERVCMDVGAGDSVILHKSKLAHLEHTIIKNYSDNIDELFVCDRAAIMAIVDAELLSEFLN